MERHILKKGMTVLGNFPMNKYRTTLFISSFASILLLSCASLAAPPPSSQPRMQGHPHPSGMHQAPHQPNHPHAAMNQHHDEDHHEHHHEHNHGDWFYPFYEVYPIVNPYYYFSYETTVESYDHSNNDNEFNNDHSDNNDNLDNNDHSENDDQSW